MISDVIVLYILRKGKFYRQKKYLNVNDSEAEGSYEIINTPTDEESKDAIPVPVSHAKLEERWWEQVLGMRECEVCTIFFYSSKSPHMLRTAPLLHLKVTSFDVHKRPNNCYLTVHVRWYICICVKHA